MKPARRRSERSRFRSGFGPVLVLPGGSCGGWGGGRAFGGVGGAGGGRGRRRPAPVPSWGLNIKLQLQGTPQGLAVFFFLGGGQWGLNSLPLPVSYRAGVSVQPSPTPPALPGVFSTPPRGVSGL